MVEQAASTHCWELVCGSADHYASHPDYGFTYRMRLPDGGWLYRYDDKLMAYVPPQAIPGPGEAPASAP